MIAPTQIRKPENWQDFEKLCKKLWGEVWICPESIKRNGRNGQSQFGVDVYGTPEGETEYYGIQCKGKDDYSKTKLTKKEIDDEIEKALNFKPPLKYYIFTTTADKDVKIEQYIREKNVEHIKKGLFNVEVFSWSDIVDLLEEYEYTYNWYVNNCQYKDVSDVEVTINNKNTFDIYPQYIRTTKYYIKKSETNADNNLREETLLKAHKYLDMPILSYSSRKMKKDYTWSTIPISIKNTGATIIEDYKLYLTFDAKKIEDIDDKYKPLNHPLVDQNVLAVENINRQNKREIFESSEYNNVIEFKPLEPILVKGEQRTFKIGVKPKCGETEIYINWEIISRNYKKEGKLFLNVIPEIEEKKELIEVENTDQVKEEEIVIEPKVIEYWS